MAKYEIIDLENTDSSKLIDIRMPFSEIRVAIRRMTKWQAIEFVFGYLSWMDLNPKNPEYIENERIRKFYNTLCNKTRDQLEKILLSKIYLEGSVSRLSNATDNSHTRRR